MRGASSTFVIAEAGVNHNGSLKLALELVESAQGCGADAVKFQTFKAERLVTREAVTAAYQQRAMPDSMSQYAMLKSLELSEADFRQIHQHCRACGIEFLSSPFDEISAAFLHELGMRTFKVPSGEITNIPLLETIGGLGKAVILSTGMCWLGEVEAALRTLKKVGAAEITLLHCVTEYPAPYDEINLSAMATLSNAFGVKVGYSDHTAGIEIPIAAVAMGATVIEKHFTLDAAMSGPDHAASMEPGDFQRMVQAIRHVESARGDGLKQPAPCERANLDVVRKSIAAGQNITEGEIITRSDLTMKRPGTGLPPSLLETIIGRRAARTIGADQLLDWRDLA
ncbi:N-acetylneuraminate synthase [Modicisalibacter muralis]|uniref:N-acetylneuraminate synthase n=1 Tax=Modicisalibacter muralis TaxID=119000 RepID=A0A1G9EVI3_9GAMM|nr:N-acetylneuraminate synthase [Halomonas muralis]SDK80149.1 N-acetylneuraminate synthase [Halomonas muralis]